MAVEVLMPRLSDSMEEATIVAWLVEDGASVSVGDPLVEIETDKATVTYEAEVAGTLLPTAAVGDTVALGAVIALLGSPDELAAPRPEVPAPGTDASPAGGVAAIAPPVASPAPATTRAKASPLARRVAASLGIELATVVGSGPGGRIVRADVEDATALPQSADAHPASAAETPAPATAKGPVTRVELGRVQQTIARRMAESRATVPDFEVAVDVDMTACVELRGQLKALTDPVPSYNDMVVKACGLALREHPKVNGAYRDAGLDLHDRVNVGVAVAGEDTLVVPTVLDADTRSLGHVARETRRLAAAVRAGTIAPVDLAGGTFTVSNLGMFGVARFSAVVNVPQAAILAVGALERRPAIDSDGTTIVARDLMTITLVADHRILYGADAARFIARVRELLERPLLLAL
ncbi:Dihydrolipoyllysine-residue succinyltransferase component of 2-oxoglutarate dehydrogenase complex [Baekduia alba]|nr:Dihydrolipoyllysine-residue succinyltransferase component of 2-oxoglutarate dehydrogenase complex [Baekduia alba]